MSSTVVVVDDDPTFTAIVRELLETRGFDVVGSATTVDGALSQIRSTRPDWALVDVSVAGQSGMELCRALTDGTDAPRVVLTSADLWSWQHQDAHNSGAVAFVPKEELIDADLGAILAA